jgi:uncharacterized Zn-finger protein
MPYICDKCGNIFRSKYNLDRHINKKISCIEDSNKTDIIAENNVVDTTNEFSCKYCSKTFTRFDNLERHIEDKRCKILKIEEEKIN